MVFVSASLPYAAHDCYAKPSKFKGCDAKAVLKFKVHPHSHPSPPVAEDGGTGPSTLRSTPHDPLIPEDEMEWYTARHGAHVLTGIFIKVDCTQQMIQRSMRTRMAAAPEYACGSWQWLNNLADRENGWQSYPEEVNSRMEGAWLAQEDRVDVSGGYHVVFRDDPSGDGQQVCTAEIHTVRAVRRVGTASPQQKVALREEVSVLQGDTPYASSRDAVTNACKFHQQCWEVLKAVGIHGAHLDHQFDRCFCDSCMAERRDRPTYSGGAHGPGTYVIPQGYAKFALKIDGARADARGFWSEWSNCYQ